MEPGGGPSRIRLVYRLLPILVFLVVATIGAAMAVTMHRSNTVARELRTEATADDIVDRIVARLDQHLSLLRGTASFFEAMNGRIGRSAFHSYVEDLEIDGRYDGIQGIGFARLIATGDEIQAESEIRNGYGVDVKVWPETKQPVRTPIVLLEPEDARNKSALGFDMFSEKVRRQAMDTAMLTQEPTASGPVELVQEITSHKQNGFLVYLPFAGKTAPPSGRASSTLPYDGFIYAPFRAGDFHTAVLRRMPATPLLMKSYDKADPDLVYFRSEGYETARNDGGFAAQREIGIAGRTWVYEFRRAVEPGFITANIVPLAVLMVSLLLAATLAIAMHSQRKALAAARALHRLSEKTLQEKDLMLQEMKHRIKNSIARMMAISRQTAASSDTLDEFTKSFTARLQAMATAQDVLTRTHWQHTDLRELLVTELAQVFGDDIEEDLIKGPPVDLNETATQAFGLTFHELATNAMKYGGMSDDGGELAIAWTLSGIGEATLVLEWAERGAPVTEPQSAGFGTKLIDANIRGELGGSIERIYGDTGLTIIISVPRKAITAADRK
ncbi:hypothetical protein CH339_01735 [Rhodobium orientis]|uniref:histidine kinase n=1 Tax=Rhodobium orientis TaxID=34017 RepID=A0A327JW33_9HYPH|nr:hypothetical protein [Rhodobium orientis]RAI29764.1 hypothetical protein CH339_01735 [Rhodobium orientis]